MIIHSNKALKKNKVVVKPEEKIEKVEAKPVNKKKHNKKSAPVVIEEIPVVEEKIEEDIDLSEWFKEENIEE